MNQNCVLHLCRLLAAALLLVPLSGSAAPVDAAAADEIIYPQVYYRGPEFAGTQCISALTVNAVSELYLLKHFYPSTLSGSEKKIVEVAEFFSGQRYRATAQKGDKFDVLIQAAGSPLALNCSGNDYSISSAPSKSNRINQNGDYLNLERVDTNGAWGSLNINNKCDGGAAGWVDCDIGTNGLTLRNADGKIIWARVIAVVSHQKGIGMLYDIPGTVLIDDRLDAGILLADGSAIFTFRDSASIRINLKNGLPFEEHNDVAAVPLDDWAALKRVMFERTFGATRPCVTSKKPESSPTCPYIGMYYFTLQSYLFPFFVSK